MADISDINSAQSVKIIGSDFSGVEQTPIQSTDAGAIHSNIRTSSGAEILTDSRASIITTELYSHFRVVGASTTVIKTSSGYLKRVTINSSSNSTLTIYDNTTATGTPIIVISSTNGVATSTLEYGINLTTGLSIISTGNATNMSILYL